jgi:hypothetical protein
MQKFEQPILEEAQPKGPGMEQLGSDQEWNQQLRDMVALLESVDVKGYKEVDMTRLLRDVEVNSDDMKALGDSFQKWSEADDGSTEKEFQARTFASIAEKYL